MTTLLEENLETATADSGKGTLSAEKSEASALMRRLEADAGVWLTSSQAFAQTTGVTRMSRSVTPNVSPSMARILHEGLNRVSLLTSRIHALEVAGGIRSDRHAKTVFTCLRDLVAMGAPAWDRPFSVPEFVSWCGLIQIGLSSATASTEYFHRAAESDGDLFGKDMLERFSGGNDPGISAAAELKLILRKFGAIFRYLETIESLMERDEPLKPGVLIFAHVEQQCSELLTLMEGRAIALRKVDEQLADAVDGAAYIASIETKKVFDHELSGILEIRPVPAIFARFEAAHALLKEGFQQTIASILRQYDDSIDVLDVYPSLKQKRENSFALRREMKALADAVAAAEAAPDSPAADAVRRSVSDFMAGPVRFLFFKDIETVERFAEEIELATAEGELQPILHRFSAFLETLIGQVSLRAVLAEEGGPQASL
ncbi:MAG: hypothetical protein IPM50_06510 [Acidobacteriota bacterium]|nr:MAG: hypothetical protein IPM50_06510 [Acidobacteriota bacterium]